MDLIFSPPTVALFVTLTVLALGLALRPDPALRTVQSRMETYLQRREPDDPAEAARSLHGSFLQRAILPGMHRLSTLLARLAPSSTLEQIGQQLQLAGRPGNMSAADFIGLSALFAAFGLVLGLLYGRSAGDPIKALAGPLAGLVLGFMMPKYWLSSRIKQRRETIQRALPDALDMLTICVEAGLAFESSLQRVSERWEGPLSAEFARVVAEIRLGVPRSQALRRLAGRCDSPDVASFVAVLVQADSMGTSIAPVIHSQADQIRVLRRQRAEEKANKAPIKVLMAMLIFIFPALFVVILGPAVPRIMEAFGNMGG